MAYLHGYGDIAVRHRTYVLCVRHTVVWLFPHLLPGKRGAGVSTISMCTYTHTCIHILLATNARYCLYAAPRRSFRLPLHFDAALYGSRQQSYRERTIITVCRWEDNHMCNTPAVYISTIAPSHLKANRHTRGILQGVTGARVKREPPQHSSRLRTRPGAPRAPMRGPNPKPETLNHKP